MKSILGLTLAFAIGFACRAFAIPSPAPLAIVGALLVVAIIQHLVAEEHRLFERGSTDPSDRGRLAAIQIELDQYWDLLRQ